MDIFYKKLSKKLAYILRHHPEEYNLELDEFGWVDLHRLLGAIQTEPNDRLVDEQSIITLIATSAKTRFELSAGKIRALYGHSTPSKINFEPTEPPAVLYHGTARRFLEEITVRGLVSRQRQHVHLSTEIDTALEVGRRHDPKPVILYVIALEAFHNGIRFYRRGEAIWLADDIPAKFILFPEK